MEPTPDSLLEIRLDFSTPIEIGDVAALFEGFGADFQRYLEAYHPSIQSNTQLYVKRIQEGSIVAHLFAAIPDMVGLMDSILIVGGFGALFSKRVRTWVRGNFVEDAKVSDLQNITNTLRAVRRDSKAKLSLSKFVYRKGVFEKELIAEFSSAEAESAGRTIEQQKLELGMATSESHKRVLMVFKRMDRDKVKPGEGTGERVVIESIDRKNRPVFYGSDLARDRVKHELTQSEFPFKLGFIVDVTVATRNGRIAAYSVTSVHDVLNLDDE